MKSASTAVVSVSGGLSSFYALRAAAEQYPEVHGVFADTAFEDEDTMRVVWMCAEVLYSAGGSLTCLWKPRPGGPYPPNPFDVFDDVKMLGSSRLDPCSDRLKRKPIRAWLDDNHDPEGTVVALGFDADEGHRLTRCAALYEPFRVVAPLADQARWTDDLVSEFRSEFGWVPWAYEHNLPHSNCSGMCVKAGIGQWLTLLRERPSVYAYAEGREEAFRERHGDYSILRDRSGGVTSPLPLRTLRERQQSQLSMFDLLDADPGGACSCFDPPVETPVSLPAERTLR